MGLTKVLVTVGTRPELIKLAPVVAALRAAPERFHTHVLFTGQHRELLDQMAEFFDLHADGDLRVMQHSQTLPELTARLIRGIDAVLEEQRPDVVLSQGDTTTVLTTALCCYYRRIAMGHVEAGLRTSDLFRPFPEEGNRRLVGPIARYHFAPTRWAADNLLREGVPSERVFVTGNTVVDALLSLSGRELPIPFEVPEGERLVLMTLHRREAFGPTFRAILRAVRAIVEQREDVRVVYPVHPNPNVQRAANEVLSGVERVQLIEPLGYGEFVGAMRRSTLILSDSGGVQEEAPSLGVPVLVLRDTTERPEGVEAGVARLVGTNPEAILNNALELLDDPAARATMQRAGNPYGDGQAAGRIVDVLGQSRG